MRCIYCGEPIDENAKRCDSCGKELNLFTKYRGQRVQKRDILQIDTLFAAVAFILMAVVLFLPVIAYHADAGTEEFTLFSMFRAVGEAGDNGGMQAWFLVLYLVFDVIFMAAWFWGRKSVHYFWMAASGTIGSWIMCVVCTFAMAEACAYLGFYSLSLMTGYVIWIIALCLQIVSLILYRWRARCLTEEEA